MTTLKRDTLDMREKEDRKAAVCAHAKQVMYGQMNKAIVPYLKGIHLILDSSFPPWLPQTTNPCT